MFKRTVSIPYIVRCNVEVTSDVDYEDDEEWIERAFEHAGLTGFVGNGGAGKLIGTSARNVTVEACDDPYESGEVKIEVFDA